MTLRGGKDMSNMINRGLIQKRSRLAVYTLDGRERVIHSAE